MTTALYQKYGEEIQLPAFEDSRADEDKGQQIGDLKRKVEK